MTRDLDKLCTPPDVLMLVRKVGTIGFDPFPCAYSVTNPTASAFEGFDAWAGESWLNAVGPGEVLFCNPPYSRGNLPRFAHFWAAEQFADTHGIALLPSRTGANWFAVMAATSKAMAFWQGRIVFWLDGKPMPGGGRFDSVLFYSGPRPHLFADVFAPVARVVMLP